MIKITATIFIDPSELTLTFITASGPGGQNVNKVATAVHLRFNVLQSPSLSSEVRARLIKQLGRRLTTQGELIIKASRFRTQEKNKQDAYERLVAILKSAAYVPKKRKKTSPTKTSIEKRLSNKKRQGAKKTQRGKQDF